MRLYVVAYPELAEGDYQIIQQYRKVHDRLYSMIEPHFTLVFLVPDFTEADFIAEVKKQVKGIKAFEFVLRCSTINKDAFSDNYFAFLVPDEGFSNIVKLHDALYADKLAHHHRMDIDYIPHIEFANSALSDKTTIKKIVDEWNSKDFAIRGRLSSLDIISFENGIVRLIENIKLN